MTLSADVLFKCSQPNRSGEAWPPPFAWVMRDGCSATAAPPALCLLEAFDHRLALELRRLAVRRLPRHAARAFLCTRTLAVGRCADHAGRAFGFGPPAVRPFADRALRAFRIAAVRPPS